MSVLDNALRKVLGCTPPHSAAPRRRMISTNTNPRFIGGYSFEAFAHKVVQPCPPSRRSGVSTVVAAETACLNDEHSWTLKPKSKSWVMVVVRVVAPTPGLEREYLRTVRTIKSLEDLGSYSNSQTSFLVFRHSSQPLLVTLDNSVSNTRNCNIFILDADQRRSHWGTSSGFL